MNNRLTIKDLAGILSKRTGRSSDTVELFLKEFVSTVKDNVFKDRLMQIKGIGTLKIIQIDQRESVDVNTKERIVIPSHYRLSFSPDKEMREMVNKPFSFFESIEINDESDITSFEVPVDDEKEEEEEVEETEEEEAEAEDMEEDIPEPELIPDRPLPETEKYIEDPSPPVEESGPVSEEPVAGQIFYQETRTDGSEADFKIKEKEEKEKEAEEVKPLKENDMSDYNDDRNRRREEDYRSPRGNNNTLVILLLVLVVILIIALGSILLLKRDAIFNGGVTKAEPVETVESDHNTFTLPDDDFYAEEPVEEEWGTGTENEAETGTPPSSGKENVIATVVTKRGDRLNLLALDYYGNKLFWVYIYEHNKSKITNPDNIGVGIELDIPAKSVYNIDANDPASVKRASVLQTQIISKYKPRRRYGNSGSRYNRYQYSDPYGWSGSNQYNSLPQNSQYGGLYDSYQGGNQPVNNQYTDPYQGIDQYNDSYQDNNQYNNNKNYNNNQKENNEYDPFWF